MSFSLKGENAVTVDACHPELAKKMVHQDEKRNLNKPFKYQQTDQDRHQQCWMTAARDWTILPYPPSPIAVVFTPEY